MSEPLGTGFPPEQQCRECGCRWAWAGTGWLCTDLQGRGTFLAVTHERGEPVPVRRDCPLCHAPLPAE